ncbi:hypothetical protein, partial [Oscillibacter sp. MSJ-31]|uniref:hypothetical protein n=2 Tax=Oscillibacter sp. MSJ-31 TaxID=2841526 RepID=UPI001C104338
ECDVLFISFLSSFLNCIKPPIALVMRSPNLYQYTAIGGFTHAKAIFLPPVELGVYFHALRRQKRKEARADGSRLFLSIFGDKSYSS